ncbi:MAG: hypothetical protein GX910_03995 [Clostridiaceae bacterium]|jgi:hypothetical protein|nr:hypothetical protein [Clostridiaceae bacterium]
MNNDSAQLKSVHTTHRSALFVITALALVLLLMLSLLSACRKGQSLTGTWELTSSQEEGYVVGMIFEFSSDGTLYISPGSAPIPSDDQVSLKNVQANDRLTYTSSRSGSLKILLQLDNAETISFAMNYEIENDRLIITDRDDVQLIFRRVN